jgi:hypothetical protein
VADVVLFLSVEMVISVGGGRVVLFDFWHGGDSCGSSWNDGLPKAVALSSSSCCVQCARCVHVCEFLA